MDIVQSILDTKGWSVLTIGVDASVHEAVAEMCKHHVGSLVVHDGKGIGILTERDIMQRVVLEGRSPVSTRVGDVMTTFDVACIEPSVDISDAMDLMTRRRCRHLPVVDAAGRVIGLLSIGDVVSWINRGLASTVSDFTAYVCGPAVSLR